MKNLVLKIEFDGTNYHGWQRQNNAVTVQETIETVLGRLMQEDIKVIGCGRTDAGVHALNYVCNFETGTNIPASRFPHALNSILPYDISVKDCYQEPLSFNARKNAVGKKYVYKIINSLFRPAIMRNYYLHFPHGLNIKEMQKAANCFIGEHDFRGFMASGSSITNTIRDIHTLSINHIEQELNIEISANGFLYNMVRIIVGTLLDVGIGKISSNQISDIINSGVRSRAGITVPPQGLYLEEVYY
jgi:tRNA pseudouridine38-40 synthase